MTILIIKKPNDDNSFADSVRIIDMNIEIV